MKLRVRSTKVGKVRFTSHRDAARMWERALRRVELPVAATEGFTPRPKLSFGLALPTGTESIAEYTDIELRSDVTAADVDLLTLPERLSDALPVGIDVVAIAERTTKGSLQQDVTSCTWELWIPQLPHEEYVAATELLDATTLVIERERKGKRRADDVRPMIIDVVVGDNASSHPYTHDEIGDRLIVDLVTVGTALRPMEFAELAFPARDPRDLRATRIHQWTDGDGSRREVLDAPTLAVASADTVEVSA